MAHVEKRITEAWCPVCNQRMVKSTEDTHLCLMHPDAGDPEPEPVVVKKDPPKVLRKKRA